MFGHEGRSSQVRLSFAVRTVRAEGFQMILLASFMAQIAATAPPRFFGQIKKRRPS